MLLCKQNGCLWHLVYLIYSQIMKRRLAAFQEREPKCPKTASIALAPAGNPLGRLFAAIDRLLLAYAETTIRNGDIPRCIV